MYVNPTALIAASIPALATACRQRVPSCQQVSLLAGIVSRCGTICTFRMVERWHRRARVLRSLGQLADIIGAAPVRGELAAATLRDVAAIATRSLHRESRAAEAQLCGAGAGLGGIWAWRPLRGPLVGRLLGGVPCFGSWERPCPPAQTRWSEYGLRAEIVSSPQGRQLLKKVDDHIFFFDGYVNCTR